MHPTPKRDMRRIYLGHRGQNAQVEQEYPHKTTSEDGVIAIDPLSADESEGEQEPHVDDFVSVTKEEAERNPDAEEPPLITTNENAPASLPASSAEVPQSNATADPSPESTHQRARALYASVETFKTTFRSHLKALRKGIQTLPQAGHSAASHNRSVRDLDKKGKLAVRSAEAQLEKLREDFARLRVDEGDGDGQASKYCTAAQTQDERGEPLRALAREAEVPERQRRREVVVDWLRYHREKCAHDVEFVGCERCLEWQMGFEGAFEES